MHFTIKAFTVGLVSAAYAVPMSANTHNARAGSGKPYDGSKDLAGKSSDLSGASLSKATRANVNIVRVNIEPIINFEFGGHRANSGVGDASSVKDQPNNASNAEVKSSGSGSPSSTTHLSPLGRLGLHLKSTTLLRTTKIKTDDGSGALSQLIPVPEPSRGKLQNAIQIFLKSHVRDFLKPGDTQTKPYLNIRPVFSGTPVEDEGGFVEFLVQLKGANGRSRCGKRDYCLVRLGFRETKTGELEGEGGVGKTGNIWASNKSGKKGEKIL